MPALGTQAVTLGTGLKWLTAWIQPATVKNLQQVVFRPAEYSQLFKNINNDRRYANKMHYYCETKRSAQIRGSLVQCLRWAFVRRPPNTQTLTPPPLVICPRPRSQYASRYSPYLEASASNCEPRTRQAVVTGIHLSRITLTWLRTGTRGGLVRKR